MNLNFNHLLLFLLISCYYAASEHNNIEASSASPPAAISEEDMDGYSIIPTSDFPEASLMIADTVICQGDLIILNDNDVNVAGCWPYIFKDNTGKDSLGMIKVVVLEPIIEGPLDEEKCFGESFLGQTTSGTFRDTIRYVNGCDSLITIYDLTIFPKIDTTTREIVILCPGASHTKMTPNKAIPLVNHPARNFVDSVNYVYTNINGCDSIVTSRIIFYRDAMSRIPAMICSRDTFYADDGQKFTTEGEHYVRLKNTNGCDSTTIIDLKVGKSTTIDTIFQLCEGQWVPIGGEKLYSGSGSKVFETIEGCDSIVNFSIEVTKTIDTTFSICVGETFTLGDFIFTESVVDFPVQIPDTAGYCNGSYSVTGTVLDCSILAKIESDSLLCSDHKNGRISFALTDGNYPFTYQWEYLGSLREGTLDTLGEKLVIQGLPAGTYTITITDVRLESEEFPITIKSPDFWDHTADESDYGGYNISCAGENDGRIEIFPIGGLPPYTYEWSTKGATTQEVMGLESGQIVVTITDYANCDHQVSFDLTEPDSLYIEIDSIKPNCDSLPTGLIEVVLEEGGVSPVKYSIQGIGDDVRGQFKNLAPGSYTLIATDANGCMQEFPTDLPGPDIPELVFNRNEFSELATPVTLDVQTNVELDRIEWSTEEGLSCYDCLTPDAAPNETTTYTIIVTSFDGCVTSEEITVNIDKKRDVYVPNIFSPNGDGDNDRFTIFGGPEVASVLIFNVYSRWGELLYNKSNSANNDSSFGWDGTFNGQKVASGNYLWIAKILFVDGETLDYKGTINLK